MGFDRLINKVKQAEDALEARERQVSADVRQFKRTWRAAWTPGRIVIAGLVGGFMAGRAPPLRGMTQGSSVLRMVSMLSTLMASTGAQSAAHEAEQAADSAENVADAVAPRAARSPAAAAPVTASADRHAPVEP